MESFYLTICFAWFLFLESPATTAVKESAAML